jgi:hypothetical protein
METSLAKLGEGSGVGFVVWTRASKGSVVGFGVVGREEFWLDCFLWRWWVEGVGRLRVHVSSRVR